MLPHGSFKPIFVDVVPVWRKQLNPMISRVRHEDLVLAVTGHVPGVVELTGLGTLLAECQQEFTADSEKLKRRKHEWLRIVSRLLLSVSLGSRAV